MTRLSKLALWSKWTVDSACTW